MILSFFSWDNISFLIFLTWLQGSSSITGTYTATNVVYNSYTGPWGPQGATGVTGTPGFSTSTGATGPVLLWLMT